MCVMGLKVTRKCFVTQSVVNSWSLLLQEVAVADSTARFRKGRAKFMAEMCSWLLNRLAGDISSGISSPIHQVPGTVLPRTHH